MAEDLEVAPGQTYLVKDLKLGPATAKAVVTEVDSEKVVFEYTRKDALTTEVRLRLVEVVWFIEHGYWEFRPERSPLDRNESLSEARALLEDGAKIAAETLDTFPSGVVWEWLLAQLSKAWRDAAPKSSSTQAEFVAGTDERDARTESGL